MEMRIGPAVVIGVAGCCVNNILWPERPADQNMPVTCPAICMDYVDPEQMETDDGEEIEDDENGQDDDVDYENEDEDEENEEEEEEEEISQPPPRARGRRGAVLGLPAFDPQSLVPPLPRACNRPSRSPSTSSSASSASFPASDNEDNELEGSPRAPPPSCLTRRQGIVGRPSSPLPPGFDALLRRRDSLHAKFPDDEGYRHLCACPSAPHIITTSVANRRREGGLKAVNQYIFVSTLGVGTHSKVKLAIHSETMEHYAVKVLSRSSLQRKLLGCENALQRTHREVAILRQLDHANIIRLVEVIDDPTSPKLYLVLEHAHQGVALKGHGQPIPESTTRGYMRDVLSALAYLHDRGILHCDVKPENVLVDRHNNALLSDFSVSHVCSSPDDDMVVHALGTPAFRSPECMEPGPHKGQPVDVWATGMSLFMFLYGYLPFLEPGVPQTLDAIRHAPLIIPEKNAFGMPISAEAADLVRLLLERDPARRPTAHRALQHAWFAGR
eukprot:TRINITY_DN107_c4_g1_i1.p1 TRINITY_DN107_c4_g1~~TRINITY_DN107_c4_g1_i1.p1  ORF type:complete len:514 (+),score=92.50 TRINITY_DN107_c4_g1_i1:44-1543(+)